MASKIGLWWQKIKQHQGAIAVVAIVLALIGVIVLGYLLNWHWTGLAPETSEPKQHTKTLWDWMQLLLVPLMLAIGGFWLNQIQKSRDERAIEQRNTTEREITLDKQREDLLQIYLDRMSELLLKEQLRSSAVDAEVRNVARVRTITILTQLDARRLSYVFTFLREAGLMLTTANDNVVSLKNADLHAVNWSEADLRLANLSEANLSGADLSGADLSLANLRGADLRGADLRGADLSLANLRGANLRLANLSEAYLRDIGLNNADLSGADLSLAYLSGADLSEADLSFAYLRDIGPVETISIPIEELEKQAKSLKDATMPDGSKHP